MAEDADFYVRYYVGHKGKFGHEFLEFEFNPDGKLRYANNSHYKNETLIRKEGTQEEENWICRELPLHLTTNSELISLHKPRCAEGAQADHHRQRSLEVRPPI